jgi:hypothetical protein
MTGCRLLTDLAMLKAITLILVGSLGAGNESTNRPMLTENWIAAGDLEKAMWCGLVCEISSAMAKTRQQTEEVAGPGATRSTVKGRHLNSELSAIPGRPRATTTPLKRCQAPRPTESEGSVDHVVGMSCNPPRDTCMAVLQPGVGVTGGRKGPQDASSQPAASHCCCYRMCAYRVCTLAQLSGLSRGLQTSRE